MPGSNDNPLGEGFGQAIAEVHWGGKIGIHFEVRLVNTKEDFNTGVGGTVRAKSYSGEQYPIPSLNKAKSFDGAYEESWDLFDFKELYEEAGAGEFLGDASGLKIADFIWDLGWITDNVDFGTDLTWKMHTRRVKEGAFTGPILFSYEHTDPVRVDGAADITANQIIMSSGSSGIPVGHFRSYGPFLTGPYEPVPGG